MRERISEHIEYNTDRELLSISEYGRSIQKLINYAVTLENREARNALAKSIVNTMQRLTVQQGDENEIRQKLYDHLFIMSDFQLDIDSPYPKPSKEKLQDKAEYIKYPSKKPYQRHFGRNIKAMIDKATEMEDSEERDALVRLLLIQMKRDYIVFKENTLNDDSLIAEQLTLLSGGKLQYSADMQVANFNPSVRTDTGSMKGTGNHRNNNKHNKNGKFFKTNRNNYKK
ncbi:MAG: DUF4290 domain-containing protein [Bacteroidales bacterium]|jgi:hypothetical protein|nr:DUF4290 domain-containing protein [Bacteroidales bacterium]